MQRSRRVGTSRNFSKLPMGMLEQAQGRHAALAAKPRAAGLAGRQHQQQVLVCPSPACRMQCRQGGARKRCCRCCCAGERILCPPEGNGWCSPGPNTAGYQPFLLSVMWYTHRLPLSTCGRNAHAWVALEGHCRCHVHQHTSSDPREVVRPRATVQALFNPSPAFHPLIAGMPCSYGCRHAAVQALPYGCPPPL